MDRKWWTLIAVCIGTFMLLIDVTIVNVALPDIQTALKSTFSDLQWVVDAYSLMLAALLLTTGSLADLFGRRRVFAIGLCIFTVSSLLSGLATTPLFLNIARGAQGVGAAAMFSTSLALLASSFRGRERGMAFGVWGTITGLAVAIGPVVGGALTTEFGWRWIFLVNVPIGVIGVIVTLLRVEESRQPGARRPDWLGALTFSGALAALVYALIQGENKGWTSTEIVSCLVGAGVLLLLFLIVETVQKAPMFDLSLFRNPTFSGGSIVAFSLSAGMFALLLYLTLYLQDVLGFTALHTGLRLLYLSGGILLTSTLAGRLTTRVPIRLLIGPGLVLVGVGLLLMRGLNAASGWEHLIPGFVVGGAGVGLINPPLASTAVGVVEPARAGMASGINSTFRQVGIATGIAGLGAIFSHSVRTKMIGLLSVTGGLPQTQAHLIAADVAQGSGVGAAVTSAPPAARAAVVNAVRVSFVGGLNEVFLIAAVLSFGAAALSLVLIRNKDFEASAAYQGGGGARPGGPTDGGAAPDPGVPAAGGSTAAVDQGAGPGVAVGEGVGLGAAVDGVAGPGAGVGEGVGSGAAVDEGAGPGVGEGVGSGVGVDGVAGPGVGVAEAVGSEPAVAPGTGTDAAGPPDAGSPAPGTADSGPADATADPVGVPSDGPAVPDRVDPPPLEAPPGDRRSPAGLASGLDRSATATVGDRLAPPGVSPGNAAAAVGGGFGSGVSPGNAAAAVGGGFGSGVSPGNAAAVVGGGLGPGVSARNGSSNEAPNENVWPAESPTTPVAVPIPAPAPPERSYAVALAAEQAAADSSRYIEELLARRHDADPGGADRAAVLRDRLNYLGEDRRRLVSRLRDHTQAVDEHIRAAREQTELAGRRGEAAAETRRQLYELIGALAALSDEARADVAGSAPPPGIVAPGGQRG
jgi:EmrB/QacA subfamily drug resistance transporter